MTTVLPSGDPNDLRFQFEIIKQLAENGRILATNIGKLQESQVAMLERLARIEANTVNDTVADLKATVAGMEVQINGLEQKENFRAGETASRAAIIKWWPIIAMTMLVVWTTGRALGFFHLPEPPVRAVQQGVGR